MTNVFIIHGAFGNPYENWFPWLKSELEKLGHKVFVPEFPTPEKQSLEKWLEVFGDYEKHMKKDSVVVGHSLGPAFLLNILQEHKVRAAFFVAGFTGLLNEPEFDDINKTITNRNFDWEKIKNNCERFYVYHSDNDPIVPLTKAEELADNLGIKVTLIRGLGHFSENITEFDFLLEEIKKEL